MNKIAIEIKKRTLFVYRGCCTQYSGDETFSVSLFDIKTMTQLSFKSPQEAIKFCELYDETECINEIHKLPTYRAASKLYIGTDIVNKKHKLINLITGILQQVSDTQLMTYVLQDTVINLELTSKKKIRINWLIEQAPKEFEEYIAEKYNEFQEGLALIGRRQDFEYKIIGKYVILTDSRSKLSRLTIPSFVDSISEYAFSSETRELFIGKGLKYIGQYALDKSVKLRLSEDNILQYMCKDNEVKVFSAK